MFFWITQELKSLRFKMYISQSSSGSFCFIERHRGIEFVLTQYKLIDNNIYRAAGLGPVKHFLNSVDAGVGGAEDALGQRPGGWRGAHKAEEVGREMEDRVLTHEINACIEQFEICIYVYITTEGKKERKAEKWGKASDVGCVCYLERSASPG